MKAFRFRMQRLLDVRRVEEEQALGAVRAAVQALSDVEAELDHLRGELAAVWRDLALQLGRGGAAPNAPAHAALHAARIDRATHDARRRRDDVRRVLAAAEDDARRRRAARRALEELAERARSVWQSESRREEAFRRNEEGWKMQMKNISHFLNQHV